MIDITHKYSTLRVAVAEAKIKIGSKGITAIKRGKVPKGDVFASAKIACLLAVKNTSNVLPHCHPIPVEYTGVSFNFNSKNEITILVEVKTIYKTGCEMEALHGASVAALTIYDMLKPVDKDIVIGEVKLLKKSGGKSGLRIDDIKIKTAIIVVSDSVYKKESKDLSGKYLKERLSSLKNINLKSFDIVPDEPEMIERKVKELCKKKFNLIVTAGGTGISRRDVTAMTIRKMLTDEIPGVMESARAFGQNRMPFAMLSNGVAGFIDDTFVMTFPGSLNAVREYSEALFPHILHVFSVREGTRH